MREREREEREREREREERMVRLPQSPEYIHPE
jgi:hypothetical protein